MSKPKKPAGETYFICENCNFVGRPKKMVKGSPAIELLLLLLFVVPGVIYGIWRLTTKYNVCPKCKKDSMVALHPSQSEVTMAGERILAEEKPARIFYAGAYILGILLLPFLGFIVPLGLLGLLFIIVAIIHRNSIRYTITNKRIKVKRGILLRTFDEIDIAHIRNVRIQQSILFRSFGGQGGYGDILIGTAGTAGYEIVIKNIKNPHERAALIKDLQSGKDLCPSLGRSSKATKELIGNTLAVRPKGCKIK